MSTAWAGRVVVNAEAVWGVSANAGDWHHCSIQSAGVLKNSVYLSPLITAFPSIFGENLFLEFEIVHQILKISKTFATSLWFGK